MTSDTDDSYHSPYELYIPIWDPEAESQPVNLTINVKPEGLEDIHPNLEDEIAKYSQADMSEMSQIEEFVGNRLYSLLESGVLVDAMCDAHGIQSPQDLQQKLDAGDVEVFPL